MTHVRGADREQSVLLPESLDDYVQAEHPVRFIDAYVDSLDLRECGFPRTVTATTGRPPYSPGDLLKLYIWGYLNRVRSSRGLETECGRNLEVIWLMRKLQPDFKTIADFRKDNATAFKAVFRQFGLLCRKLDLWGSELVAIDGTKLKAVNSIDRNYHRKEIKEWLERLDRQVQDYFSQLARNDAQEVEAPAAASTLLPEKITRLITKREELRDLLRTMEESGTDEHSATDPDSRRMKKVGVGYNAQIAVDDKHHLIVEAEVMNSKNDLGEFLSMVEATGESMGVALSNPATAKPKFTADRGYHQRQDLAKAEEAGVESYVPSPLRGDAVAKGLFHKTQFNYDAKSDTYQCPGGEVLKRRWKATHHGEPSFTYVNPSACYRCPIRAKCTEGKYRQIIRWEKEGLLEQIAKRVAAHPEISRRRSALVEHVFGTMKFWRNQAAFLTKGFDRVRAEFRLSALAYNITRVLTLVGWKPLMAALG
jgi:transposase